MGRRRCCCGNCWVWEDHFNRSASTNLGADWNEVAGNWEIVDADTGDMCGGCPSPHNQLHEKAGETVGGGSNTGSAKVISTKQVPADSAGEMSIYVYVMDPQEGDVFFIYPCCTDSSTVGSVSCKYEYLGSHEWTISILGGSTTSVTIHLAPFTPKSGHVAYRLWACADHEVQQVRAGGLQLGEETAWEDCLDPGTGRYFGLGHDNADHGAVFDDFYVTEIRDATQQCTECWCWCLTTTVRKRLYAEIFDATGRAACLDGLGWNMTWDDVTVTPARWLGVAPMPLAGGGTRDVHWEVTCSSGEDNLPSWPGKNITLSATDGCVGMTGVLVPISWIPNPDSSTCDPLSLEFGPIMMATGDLACSICYNPLSGPDEGEFYVRLTELPC